MHVATPRHIGSCATKALCVIAPTPLLVAAAWVWDVIPDSHPVIAMMLFTGSVAMAAMLGVTVMLARCHLAIAQSFAAGIQVGRSLPPDDPAPRLRVVK